MEISQFYLGDYFGRLRIQALEDRVIITYKNLLREYSYEYSYNELKPNVARGRMGDRGWNTLGWFLLLLNFLVALVFSYVKRFVTLDIYRLIAIGLTIPMIIAFSLQLIKYEFVAFVTRHGNSAFIIKLAGGQREIADKMVAYITERVIRAEGS